QRFNYINKRVEELIGKDQEYVIAMGPHLFQAILYPGDLANRTDYMSQLSTLKENEIRSHEFRIWVSNNFQWFRSRESIFFQESGTVRQVIGIAENINFEKLLEEKVLRENGKLGLN
ncbi:MAG TPA: PAS domain S-box protein, partial [Flavisolibacter sp.]|nr:PAS domain S-box protein [Flavisolibacter sp.]